ncbi:putative lysophospholipase [Bacteriovorax sp. BAL6_X]|uniref:alpha/beta fold hydrolase n=1 Tax=Bacteriovorax sp. BAL6_X TaxID=1201290 RepID=UPI000386D993|nr:alpha/beta fold hydrolase [Bacteriovorax sp. BAL6_X]EPZ51782.1 putative lysophospholipase [Bacteriovorax sp. BAL6_X]
MDTSIYIREYRSDKEDAKTVILFHDIGGGHYTFDSLIPLLVEEGLHVVSFDYLGHGLSSGTRGHFESIDEVKNFLKELYYNSKLAQGDEVYTLAVNQGALISLLFSTLFDNVKGNIFLNPKIRIEFNKNLKNELLSKIPWQPNFLSRYHIKLSKQSNDLTANNFVTKRTLIVLNQILKKVQLDVYFMECRNLIFSSNKDSIIFETIMSEFRDEIEIPEFNSVKAIKKQDIIFKETYNWIYEN